MHSLMKTLLLLFLISLSLSSEMNRRLKSKRAHPDDGFQNIEFFAKRHSTGHFCRLKMNLRENPMELMSSATNYQNVKVIGDQCYCKYHEQGNYNNCGELLTDP